MPKHLAHIKTTEVIGLPDYGIEDVRAKIDTGADSSAIWASDIQEADGVLSFKLFGPSSGYYTDQIIKTKRYSRVRVKNSFGHMESRYRVEMKLRLDDRVIKARINLANRSTNRYPVLIGRRTVRGKFLIDASARRLTKNNAQILILARQNDEMVNWIAELSKDGMRIVTATYNDLLIGLGDKRNRITIGAKGEDIADFALVFLRAGSIKGHADVAAAVANYLSNRHVEFIDRTVVSYSLNSRLLQYVNLYDHGVQIPRTVFLTPPQLSRNFDKCVAELGTPFVLKSTLMSQAGHTYLVNSRQDFDRIIAQADDLGLWLLAQQYIDSDYSYKLLVFGRQVGLIIRRKHHNNQSNLDSIPKSDEVSLVDITAMPPAVIRRSVTAAQGLGLRMAGVDFIQDKHSKLWYCLEVKRAPQIDGGEFVEQKQASLAKYLQAFLSNN